VTPGGGEYQRKEKEGGGRGRGRGGKGRGGGRGQAQEFRPINKEPSPSLFVSNLPDGANENSVADLFKKFGTVKSVDFPTEKNFCFVHFESQEGVESAMGTDDDLLWDNFAVWYEPKRLPTPKGAGQGAGQGAGRGTGGQKAASGEKKKQNPTSGKGDGKSQNQSQKQPQQPSRQGTGKQQSQSQNPNQDGDGQGPWQNVAYRRREKKGAESESDISSELRASMSTPSSTSTCPSPLRMDRSPEKGDPKDKIVQWFKDHPLDSIRNCAPTVEGLSFHEILSVPKEDWKQAAGTLEATSVMSFLSRYL